MLIMGELYKRIRKQDCIGISDSCMKVRLIGLENELENNANGYNYNK